jgi:hypothetical protein
MGYNGATGKLAAAHSFEKHALGVALDFYACRDAQGPDFGLLDERLLTFDQRRATQKAAFLGELFIADFRPDSQAGCFEILTRRPQSRCVRGCAVNSTTSKSISRSTTPCARAGSPSWGLNPACGISVPLIKARIERNLTQKEPAGAPSLAKQHIQRYEATKYRGVAAERLQEVADALKLRVREVFTLEPS